jgi:hypothetical protein
VEGRGFRGSVRSAVAQEQANVVCCLLNLVWALKGPVAPDRRAYSWNSETNGLENITFRTTHLHCMLGWVFSPF